MQSTVISTLFKTDLKVYGFKSVHDIGIHFINNLCQFFLPKFICKFLTHSDTVIVGRLQNSKSYKNHQKLLCWIFHFTFAALWMVSKSASFSIHASSTAGSASGLMYVYKKSINVLILLILIYVWILTLDISCKETL